ncbi:MAG: esterase-like activity of phytase family protein [Gemmatimonadota bacterium]
MTWRPALPLVAIALALGACAPLPPSDPARPDPGSPPSGPDATARVPAETLGEWGELVVPTGGYGSALAAHPVSPALLYLLTDRGPNVDGSGGCDKLFPFPAFAPRIVLVERVDDELRLHRTIPLRRPDRTLASGLPNPPGAGGTGEIPCTPDGARLPFDPGGLDPEGLVAWDDGSFWVADEYGPHVVRFGPDGVERERRSPLDGGLPAVLSRRRPNRGMEGLTRVPGTEVLVGAMQSPLDNPDEGVRERSRVVRLVAIDVAHGATRQFAYLLDAPEGRVSAAVAIADSTLLVAETDAEMPGDGSAVQRIYRVDLRGATDVGDPADAPAGRTFDGRTLEELADSAGLAAAGVAPVRKALAVDLLAAGFPHDKPEGLALLVDGALALSNDDDFGLADAEGGAAPKVLPVLGVRDFSEVRFLSIPAEATPP